MTEETPVPVRQPQCAVDGHGMGPEAADATGTQSTRVMTWIALTGEDGERDEQATTLVGAAGSGQAPDRDGSERVAEEVGEGDEDGEPDKGSAQRGEVCVHEWPRSYTN
jgi:hypothetical protein